MTGTELGGGDGRLGRRQLQGAQAACSPPPKAHLLVSSPDSTLRSRQQNLGDPGGKGAPWAWFEGNSLLTISPWARPPEGPQEPASLGRGGHRDTQLRGTDQRSQGVCEPPVPPSHSV